MSAEAREEPATGTKTSFDHLDDLEDGATCPDCCGKRLNALSSAVKLPLRSRIKDHELGLGENVSLPELLKLTPSQLLLVLKNLKTNKRSKPVLDELLPEIEERMRFMDRVGLNYLSLDRATATLSGVKLNESVWPRNSDQTYQACSTSSTSHPSVCTHGTMRSSSNPSINYANEVIHLSSLSTTRPPCGRLTKF